MICIQIFKMKLFGSLFSLILVFVIIVAVDAFDLSKKNDNTKRNLTSSFDCSDNGTVVAYTRADGKHDSLHYISSTYGIPTILVARTTLQTTCHIACEAFHAHQDESVKFSNEPLYIYSISFTKVYEYDDKKDAADLTDKTVKNLTPHDWKTIDLRRLNWTHTINKSDLASHTLEWSTSQDQDDLKFRKKGSLSFTIENYHKEGRNTQLPRLLFNGNGSHIFFTLDNLLPSYEHSRYVLEVSFISVDQQKHSKKSEINLHKSLDDEHTPGVFDTIAWAVQEKADKLGAYLQWKPICYTNRKPSIQASTSAKHYDVIDVNVTKDDFSVAMAYFGLDALSSGSILVQSTNISFGLSKDKFYNNAYYTKWTFAVGYGTPPQDAISGLIIVIISVGLGIPVILVVLGSICACVRKRKANESEFSSSYTAIQ